jgi:hypothetical protein
MFIQVIQGKTSQPEALRDLTDRWIRDLGPGAVGWLGSTAGVTEDGRFLAAVRFESEEAAQHNSDRPEQGAWWAEVEKLLDGEATFKNSTYVIVDIPGDRNPDDAGFVQVIQGRGNNPERAREIMEASAGSEVFAQARPDVIGSVMAEHDGGAYTMVIYFTSEAEAREGEKKEMPKEMAAEMEELTEMSIGEPEFFDLKEPWLRSA